MKIRTVLLLFLQLSKLNGFEEAHSKANRTKRVFSLFSIVQFPNLACSSTSGTYANGTCYTASECSAKSGSAQGNCAAGFGVCCIYICRIRLDYDIFTLTTPNTANAKGGQCDTDKMTIKTTDRTVVPGTGTTGTYGNYPQLCGTNTGLHSYVDLSCTTTDEATISFTLGDSTNNQYKVKVTQYSCNDPCISSREGCFQYFTGVTGTINSYNLANAGQLSTLDYKNCIRQEAGYCCIEYTVISWAVSATACAAAATRCASASTCTSEYIIIPNAINSGNVDLNYDRFCGVNLNPVGFPAANLPIRTCQCPFEIHHVTDVTALGGTGAAATEDGFSIKYRQIPGGC